MTITPVAVAVSHWAQDPWSRGSWSLIGRGGSPQDRVTLGQPVGTRLRLAGEATHASRAGMTHGAYEQGVEAGSWAAGLGHGRIAVVGAGMAGLAAARTLIDRGREVVVLEARDRTGGRTTGTELDGTGFDLGANWLQQFDGSVLARLAERLGLRLVPTDFGDPLIHDGREVPAGLEAELRARLAAAPVETAIADVVEAWAAAPGSWSPEDVRRYVAAEIVMDSGAPLSWLSARHGFEPGVGEGDRWIVGGYRLLVDHLAAGVEIRLGHPVHRIEVDDDGVTVGGERFGAVIVTVPLGALDDITFVPELPAAHRTARSRLGMGRVEKIILRFEERFWPEHPAGYHRVHGPGEYDISEWLDATAADGTPTLVGLFAGPWLDELWTGTDAEIAARVVAGLSFRAKNAAGPAGRLA
ncbi:MAG TPA: FAD-dependent oxidoreductase [Actinoplanes sp.]|nr:FAD-dependent oxidoreductase [Actinoplanes sp.]